MTVEKINYPPLDPNLQQKFDARHDIAVATLKGMHRLAATTPLPEGEWSTPAYQSFSNNDVLGNTPLQHGSATEDMVERGYRMDANGHREHVIRIGTKTIGDVEFTRILAPRKLPADENYNGVLVKTADLDAVLAAKRAETSDRNAQKARQARPIGVTILTNISRAGAKSTAELMDKYDPDFHAARPRPTIVKGAQGPAGQKSKPNQPRRYPLWKSQ